MGGTASRVVLFVAIVAIAIYVKIGRMTEFGDEVKAEMKPLILALDVSEHDTVFLDQQFDIAHLVAFNEAYHAGGRRSRATFDEDAYLDKLFDHLLDNARQRNKADLVDRLTGLRDTMRAGAGPTE